jgi:hypothetical protein
MVEQNGLAEVHGISVPVQHPPEANTLLEQIRRITKTNNMSFFM